MKLEVAISLVSCLKNPCRRCVLIKLLLDSTPNSNLSLRITLALLARHLANISNHRGFSGNSNGSDAVLKGFDKQAANQKQQANLSSKWSGLRTLLALQK